MKWLLIIDSVDEIEGDNNIINLISRGENGFVLITSRDSRSDEIANMDFEIKKMS